MHSLAELKGPRILPEFRCSKWIHNIFGYYKYPSKRYKYCDVIIGDNFLQKPLASISMAIIPSLVLGLIPSVYYDANLNIISM